MLQHGLEAKAFALSQVDTPRNHSLANIQCVKSWTDVWHILVVIALDSFARKKILRSRKCFPEADYIYAYIYTYVYIYIQRIYIYIRSCSLQLPIGIILQTDLTTSVNLLRRQELQEANRASNLALKCSPVGLAESSDLIDW